MPRTWILACAATLALTACTERDATAPTSEKAAEAAGDKTLGQRARQRRQIRCGDQGGGARGRAGRAYPLYRTGPQRRGVRQIARRDAVDALMKPEGRKQLTAVLSNHILPGTMLAADIGKAIDSGGGKTQIATLGGGTLERVAERRVDRARRCRWDQGDGGERRWTAVERGYPPHRRGPDARNLIRKQIKIRPRVS